jgi:hypothetical protein
MLKKLEIKPGIVKSNSEYAEPGRYIDAQWTRFVAGFAQKMGGWTAAAADRSLAGICRNILTWRDNTEIAHAAFGTHKKLFVLTWGVITDITPLRGRNTGNLSGALTTTNASTVVTVAHTAHKQKVGDWVTLTASAAVGGLTIAGNYLVATVPGVDSYTIAASSAATSGASGGGTIAYVYYRLLLGADPIATISGSPNVTITDANSLVVEDDTVIFDGATAVGGITLSGSYLVVSATTAGYTINAGSNASSTTTGGGSVVTVENEIGIGLIDSAAGQGWGIGPWGGGTWGTPRTVAGVPLILLLRSWALQAYGQWLLANPRGGALYMWDPSIGGRAIALYGAPTTMLSFFVTAERYIIALGTAGDSMQIAWPDQLDPNDWTAATTNTANESRKIIGGNFIMSGTQVRYQTSLLWTDTDTFLHQWRQDDYVFTTALLATKCGIVGPNAFTALGEVVYWVGDGHFWKWDGALGEIPSKDIAEWFFSRLDRSQDAKIIMGTIAPFNELIVLYQEIGESEIGHYLTYNIKDEIWSPGALERTAWLDRGLFPSPMSTDAAGVIWDHESGVDGAGEAIPAWVTAAPLDVSAGENGLDIVGFFPDVARQTGALSLYVLTRRRAEDTPESSGPFTVDTAGDTIDLRTEGKMAGYQLISNEVGGDFRLGICRVEAKTGGGRRP